MNYDELFSTFGYRSLDIIFDFDTSELEEQDLKKLSLLLVHAENNTLINEQVTEIMNMKEEASVKIKALLSLADSIGN